METYTLHKLREYASKAVSYHEKRFLLLRGLLFANLTIQRGTAKAELLFTETVNANYPIDIIPVLEKHKGLRFARSVRSRWIGSLLLSEYQVNRIWDYGNGSSGEPERIVATINGYQSVKASFSLACAGIGKNGCLDMHIGRIFGIKKILETNSGRKWDKQWSVYRELQELCFPGSPDYALSQWQYWITYLAETTGYATDHACLLHGLPDLKQWGKREF